MAEEYEIEEQDDGSAVVSLPEDDTAYESESFGENMAEGLDGNDLRNIGQDLCDLIESDIESAKERDKQYAEGIKRTGLGKDSPGGAGFVGASKVVHPMLAKGCVDFASRAIKELFPSQGPCKTQIIGESDDAKLDKAERKKTYLNWQLTTRISEQRAEFERLLSQLPLAGSQYKRWWWDDAMERPRTEVVYDDNVFLPYGQADFYTSPRVTHRQWVTRSEYDSRIASGLYRDLALSSPSSIDSEQSRAMAATDKVEGVREDETAYNDEGLRQIFLVYAELDIEDCGMSPYIVHIEENTSQVLGLYRNWAETDEKRQKKHWMVEYNFIPWRGAKAVGLYHLIGSLSDASTGSLRALLDSALIANFPGALKLKGGRAAGETITVNATELQEIAAPAGVDDIRKLVMPFPFPGPSNVLFTLLEWLTNQGEGMIATASDKLADAGANTPVGTALALIEHGSVNFSAIHARCHASLKRELEILHRLNAENMTDEETIEELGSLVVTRQDFQGPLDIIPVSDPNIFSEAQRYAQIQAVMQLKADPGFAPYFKQDRLLQRALRLLQISNAEDLANLPKDPKRLSALEENYLVGSPEPGPLKAYHEQDDVAHLETHLHFLVSPMFGANPLIGSVVYMPMMGHIKDHMMNLYRKNSKAAAEALMMLSEPMGAQITWEQAEAKGAAFAEQAMATLLGPMIMPALGQAQQLAAQFAPKPPVDPAVTAKIEADKAIEAMRIDATMKQLQLTIPEADKERQLKVTMKDHDLQFQQARDDADREQNDRATIAATALEKFSIDNSNTLAQFKADADAARAADAQAAEMLRQQRKEEADAQLVILQAFLAQQAEALAAQNLVTTQQAQADLSGALGPLLEAMQANTQATMAQFAKGFADLHASHKAPRVASFIKGPDGRNIGARSEIAS
jgi:hypothetical protein